MQLLFHGQRGERHGSRARGPNDDVTKHDGNTQANTKLYRLGLQRTYLILNIHFLISSNSIGTCQTRYLPTSIKWPCHRLMFRAACQDHKFFLGWSLTNGVAWYYSNSEQRLNNINRKPHRKVTKLKSKSPLSCVSLIGLWTARLGLLICILFSWQPPYLLLKWNYPFH